MRKGRFSARAIGAGALLLASPTYGQLTFQTISLSGRSAPGAGGVSYGFSLQPQLSDSGQIAFESSLTGNGVDGGNDAATFVGTRSSPALLFRKGDSAPGVSPGVVYDSATLPRLNNNNQVLYDVRLRGTGVTDSNSWTLYGGALSAPQLVARGGDAAPGTPAGVNYLTVTALSVNEAGQILYDAVLTDGAVAVYTGAPNAPQLVARTGAQAPGTAAGVNYASIVRPTLNDLGQMTYVATLTGTGVTAANDEAIYGGTPAAPQIIARENDLAPGAGAGVRYAGLNNNHRFAPNDAGQIAYSGMLKGTGVNASNNWGLFGGPLAAPTMIARAGQAAPGLGAGIAYAGFSNVSVNDAGTLAYHATVAGPGVTFENNGVLYLGDPAAATIVARTGDPAPGSPPGVNYGLFSDPRVNDLGQVAFVSQSAGPGAGNLQRGLYAYDPNLGGMKIARIGDLFDVGGGDLRQVSDIGFFQGRDDGYGGLTNDGHLGFSLTFTDGTSGVFTAAVPEPATLSLLAVAGLGLLRRRRVGERSAAR